MENMNPDIRVLRGKKGLFFNFPEKPTEFLLLAHMLVFVDLGFPTSHL